MAIWPLSPTPNTDLSTNVTQRKTALSQEDFLNLFVTQMRYQNPLEPLDNNQMATQMVQFGSLEALNNMNQSLQNVASYQASMNSLQAVGLLGQKVEASGNGLFIDNGAISEGYYQLSQSGRVTIKIYNGNNQLVRVIEEGIKDTSKQKFTWDGKDGNGNSLPDGAYTFQVSAVDARGQSIKANPWMVGTIIGISFENGTTYLETKSGKITLSEIVAILK